MPKRTRTSDRYLADPVLTCLGILLLALVLAPSLSARPAPPSNLCIQVNGVERCAEGEDLPPSSPSESGEPSGSPNVPQPPQANSPKPAPDSGPSQGEAGGSGAGRGRYPASIANPDNFHPGYYVFFGERDSIDEFNLIRDIPAFVGVKKLYSWRKMEPQRGVYDFSEIERDLAYLQSIGKRLWLQVKETQYFAKYEPHVPQYMWNDPTYGCGSRSPDGRRFYGTFWRDVHDGHWVVCRGDEEFDERHRALFTALGNRFDREPFIEGITLDETSTGLNPHGASVIYNSFKELALATKRAFPNKVVTQMINYAPFDLEKFAEFLRENGIATGGPDVHPLRADSALKEVYAIHKRNHWDTPNNIDVQWCNWDCYGQTFSSRQLLEVAIDRIDPWYIFWERHPKYFSNDVVPTLREFPLPAAEGFYNR